MIWALRLHANYGRSELPLFSIIKRRLEASTVVHSPRPGIIATCIAFRVVVAERVRRKATTTSGSSSTRIATTCGVVKATTSREPTTSRISRKYYKLLRDVTDYVVGFVIDLCFAVLEFG